MGSCDALVRLTAAWRPAFVFVSTVSAAGRFAREDLASTPAAAVGRGGLGLGGYGQSKWVAERRLARALGVGRLRRLVIARLGLVGPSTVDGRVRIA